MHKIQAIDIQYYKGMGYNVWGICREIMMDWYYVQNGRQIGPVTEDELAQQVRSGVVTADTLVWRTDMTDWRPYSDIYSGVYTGDLPASLQTCSQCGRQFREDEVIQYNSLWVCASCKPAFFQKVKEGASLPGLYTYADFGIRFLAKFIDGCIMGVAYAATIGVATFTALMPMSRGHEPGVMANLFMAGMYLIYFFIGVAYNVFFLTKYAATPGKMATGLKVIVADGGPVDFKKALLRYFCELLSGLICYVGYLMAAFDDERRTLHDRICNTRVIRK